MNVILATTNKPINATITALREVNVLTTITKREQIIDRALQLNPHVLVLGRELPGKLDWRELIHRVRELRPDMRVVFWYGDSDDEVNLFCDFLVRAGVYDILTDTPSDLEIQELIQTPISRTQAESWHLLSDSPPDATVLSEEAVDAPPSDELPPAPTVSLFPMSGTPQTVTPIHISKITIGVGSLFPRAGCTHTTLLVGMYLHRQKQDVGVVVAPSVYTALTDYFELTDGKQLLIEGLPIYNNLHQATSKHAVVVVDDGLLSDDTVQFRFFARTIKLLICPCAPWEIDTLTAFLRDNADTGVIQHLQYLFYPVAQDYFEELRRNMASGGARAFHLVDASDWTTDTCNDVMLAQALREFE